jgi:hypothetical protein
MEDAFERWNEYLQGMVIESAVGDEQKIQLELMALQLKMKYEGKYKKRIENFKRHKKAKLLKIIHKFSSKR